MNSSKLTLVASALLIAVFAIPPWLGAQGSNPVPLPNAEQRYLLVRRARGDVTLSENWYDLTRLADFLERHSSEELRQYKPSPKNYGFDVASERTGRYGVYQAWRVRIVSTSDSQKSPVSTKDAVYVLLYPRNPDWIFGATKYSVVSTQAGAKKITYTDLQDGHEYTIDLSPEWPRPWQIYEVEILASNVFAEILAAQAGCIPPLQG